MFRRSAWACPLFADAFQSFLVMLLTNWTGLLGTPFVLGRRVREGSGCRRSSSALGKRALGARQPNSLAPSDPANVLQGVGVEAVPGTKVGLAWVLHCAGAGFAVLPDVESRGLGTGKGTGPGS